MLIFVPFIFANYAVEITATYHGNFRKGFMISGISFLIYIVIVLLNLKNRLIFDYTEAGYRLGPFKYITYFYMIFYIVQTVLVILRSRKYMATRLFFVFMVYPFISILIMMIQFKYPRCLMSGTASFSSLLLAYITIQSDMLDYDFTTGLMTEHRLKKHLSLRTTEGVLLVFSIENINNIQNSIQVYQLNQILLSFGNTFSKYISKRSYHISINRFAALTENIDHAKYIAQGINNFIANLNQNGGLPIQIETCCVAVPIEKGEHSYTNITEIINKLITKTKIATSKDLIICDEGILLELERQNIIYKILKRELNINSTQFEVYFQPIFSLHEKKFTYMEALSRLQNTPELGNVSPFEFVSVAENRGLIDLLGKVAFQKICKFISENKDVVRAVSVNFSVLQMTKPNITERVIHEIQRFGIKPSNIIIEITESIFIADYNTVFKNIIELKKYGIQFYLDDFGTGYSNLTNVIALPFSTIKIDRNLLLMMEENSRNEKFFNNIVSTFKDSGLKILVEGVETSHQNDLVKAAGADFIQGYLYSRPLSPKKCIELLKKDFIE